MSRALTGAPVPGWLPALFGALALAALPGVMPRVDLDARDRDVELAVDLRSLMEQAQVLGKTRREVLADLARVGVTAAALHPLSLADLVEQGLVTRIETLGDRRSYRIEPAAAALGVPERLARFTPVTRRDDLLEVPGAGPLLEGLRLFLPTGIAEELREAGLRPVYRLKNSGHREDYAANLLEAVAPGSLVVFDDKEALGFPADLRRVAGWMRERQLAVGLVEFAGQRGVESLAAAGGLRMENVHSIPEDELEKYPVERVLPRWVRAATERRLRVLYLRPFPPHNLPYREVSGYAANLRYFRRVIEVLAESGFQPGAPLDPGTQATLAPAPARLAACLAAGVATAWALAYFRLLPASVLLVLGLLGSLLAGLAGGARGAGLVANLLALAAACSAPAAAVLQGYEGATRSRRPLVATLQALALAYLASVAAGTVVFCLLSDPGYLTRAYEFRGVKLVYLGPLALVAAYHLHRLDWHRRRLRVVDLGVLGLAGLLGLVYLLRSGNFSPIPASAAEHGLRDRLEAALPYRPRTKEVAFGYPALGFMASAAARADAFWGGWGSLGGAVAAVSATNSFCHLKTPFVASVGRGAVGLAFGVPLALLAGMLHLLVRRRRGRRWVVAGYAGFGNLGDDWITSNLLAELEARRPRDVELVLLVPDPAAGRARFGVRTVSRTDWLGLIEELRHATLFVTGPGGLIQDRTSWRTPAYYLGLHGLARLLGVPRTAFLGEGFGPLRSRLARHLLAFYTASADLCLVRDRTSLELAGPGAVLGPDACLWGEPLPDRLDPAPEAGPVGLVLRDLPEGRPCFALPLARALAELVRDRGLAALHLMPAFPRQDAALIEVCRQALVDEGLPVEVTPLEEALDRGLLGELAALASMRLHGCALALEHQVPLLGLPYDPKVEWLLEAAGYPFRASPEGDPGEVRRELERLLDSRDEAAACLREARRLLRLGQEEVHRSLDTLCGRPHAGPHGDFSSADPPEETPVRQLP